MNIGRILFHLARADFLERVRRYSFLIILGLMVYLGYLVNSGDLSLRLPPYYRGEINSAWVGTMMSLVINFHFSLLGFYLVNNSIGRDNNTRVGQIIATTPLSKIAYLSGKWLSNLLVLGVMVVVLAAAALIMLVLRGEAAQINLWALFAPFIFVSIPMLALISAAAIFFESVSWLRGGLGNIIYFFGWITIVSTEVTNETSSFAGPIGLGVYRASLTAAGHARYPEYESGIALSITPGLDFKTFPWDGILWTPDVILQRLVWITVALAIVAAAALLFDRFNPDRALPEKKTRSMFRDANNTLEKHFPKSFPGAQILSDFFTTRSPHETRGARIGSNFFTLFTVELRLFLKGQPWWWYPIALGLLLGQLFSQLETTRIILVIAWVWPILLLSSLGCREARHNTRQIVFSSPHPLAAQLPAAWLAAAAVLVLLGSGALLRFLIAGNVVSIMGWVTGAIFIPSLALVSGVLTGSGKTFEVIYVLWMYILLQQIPSVDFIGMTPESPWYLYAPASLILFALAAFARQRQLTARSTYQ